MSIRIADADALVEACLEDGHAFGAITKHLRDEWPELSVRGAIDVASWSLQSIASCRRAYPIGIKAKKKLDDWNADHPTYKFGVIND